MSNQNTARLTIDDSVKDHVISLYNMDMPIKEIAEKLKLSLSLTSMIVFDYKHELERDIINAKKAIKRKPEVGMPFKAPDGKIWYDYTDWFIDRPCIYSGNKDTEDDADKISLDDIANLAKEMNK